MRIALCAICTFPATVGSGDAVQLLGECGASCLEPLGGVGVADGGGDGSVAKFGWPPENSLNPNGADHVRVQVASF